jgi:zinc protease
MGEQDFKDYYTKWYIPSNMTLMVVADMDEKQVVELITKAFGGGEKRPKPADQDVGVKAQSAPRAIVASDPELSEASISIDRVEPPRTAALTVPQMKEDMIESLAQMCFDRRMERKINEGTLKAQDISSSSGEIANAIRLSSVSATGEPGAWKNLLTELATELQRARLHGFSAKELDDAKARMLAGAERSVQIEPTMQASVMLRMMNSRVAAGEPIMSPEQRLKLVKELLPQIELKDVSWAFSKMFDPSNATFVATLPSSADVPSEADFLKLGIAAVGVEPAAETVADGAKSILEQAPTPGAVAQLSEHPATGVHTALLANNVLVHHRFMDYKKNEATISITMAGGEIEETAENRGVTQAAMLAFDKAATGRLSSNDVTDLMSGKKVSVRGGAGRDAVTLSVSGDPAELEIGMQLAFALLTDGKVEQPAFDQWKIDAAQRIAERKKQPMGMIQEAMSSTIAPAGEPRLRPLEKEQLDRLTRDQAQAWFTRLVTTAPMEVSVVGDISQERAMALVTTYLGSLPTRTAISDKTLDELRALKRPVGPLSNHLELATQTPVAVVINGFFGADQENVRDARLLQVASRVLSTRMNTVIREQEQLVYSIGAQSMASGDYPGYGMFFAAAPTEPGKSDALDARIAAMYAEFAKGGPTDEEMEVARKQFANTFDEQMREPGYWSARLGSLAYRATNLDDIVAAPEAFQKFTAAEVKEAFARYCTPEASMSIIVRPAKAAPADGASPQAKPAEAAPASGK